MQLDFSARFDRAKLMDIFYRLRIVGVGGSGLSVLSQFLVARYQYAVVDGARSDRVELVSVVPQGST